MAHSRSAKKRVRQNETHRARNRWRLNTLREATKEFLEKILHGTPAEAADAFKKLSRIIDRSASVGIIHQNAAARRKSRLSARLKAKKAAA